MLSMLVLCLCRRFVSRKTARHARHHRWPTISRSPGTRQAKSIGRYMRKFVSKKSASALKMPRLNRTTSTPLRPHCHPCHLWDNSQQALQSSPISIERRQPRRSIFLGAPILVRYMKRHHLTGHARSHRRHYRAWGAHGTGRASRGRIGNSRHCILGVCPAHVDAQRNHFWKAHAERSLARSDRRSLVCPSWMAHTSAKLRSRRACHVPRSF